MPRAVGGCDVKLTDEIEVVGPHRLRQDAPVARLDRAEFGIVGRQKDDTARFKIGLGFIFVLFFLLFFLRLVFRVGAAATATGQRQPQKN